MDTGNWKRKRKKKYYDGEYKFNNSQCSSLKKEVSVKTKDDGLGSMYRRDTFIWAVKAGTILLNTRNDGDITLELSGGWSVEVEKDNHGFFE